MTRRERWNPRLFAEGVLVAHSKVIIIDYGSQATQLIARRVREAGVYSEIHSCVTTAEQVRLCAPRP